MIHQFIIDNRLHDILTVDPNVALAHIVDAANALTAEAVAASTSDVLDADDLAELRQFIQEQAHAIVVSYLPVAYSADSVTVKVAADASTGFTALTVTPTQ